MLILIVGGLLGWVALCLLAAALWCALTWACGTRDCNPPALRAARRAHLTARRDFVATHMNR